MVEIRNNTPDKCFKTGLAGSIIAAICCATPILPFILALVGLAVFTRYLDYVLLPVLGLFLVLAIYGWVKSGGGKPKSN